MRDRDYNKELVKRGEMLIDLSLFESLTTPDAKPKRGRPYTYPKALIFLLLLLKFSLRLPYRQTEGLARKIFSSLGVAIHNFRILHYRLTKEEINLEDLPQIENLQDDFVIVLDSTGLKVTNRGEWLRKKHGKRARRGWIKLHVAFDINSKQVVSVEVTDERTHDSQKAEELVETARQKAKEKCKRVEKVIADRGYDIHRIFRYMHERGIEPCILPRSSAKISGNIARDKVMGLKGKRAWKEASGYGKRWLVESFFSVFKRWFGEYVSHMKIENIRKEVMFKVLVINLFLGLGS